MEQQAQAHAQPVPADLLKRAGTMPANVRLEQFNPLENIPTIAVGEEFEEGMTVAGYFEETQVIASPKFKHSKVKNAEGVPTQKRHVLRVGSPTGEKLAIWSTGELGLAFDKLAKGEFISLKYLRKGENASGNQQHFFEYGRGAAAAQ